MFIRREAAPQVGTWSGDYPDQWYELQFGVDDLSDKVRLHNRGSNTALINRSHQSPHTWYVPYPAYWNNPDLFFGFEFEEMDFVGIDYHTDRGVLGPSRLLSLDEIILDNDTSVEQTKSHTLEGSVTETSQFEFGLGFKIGMSMEASVGIPVVAEGSISANFEMHTEFKWGKRTSRTTTRTVTIPVTVPPRMSAKATMTVTTAVMEVPFTCRMRSKVTKMPVSKRDSYRGVTYFNVQTRVVETPLRPKVGRDGLNDSHFTSYLIPGIVKAQPVVFDPPSEIVIDPKTIVDPGEYVEDDTAVKA